MPEFSPAHIALINELVPTAAKQAYRIGAVSARCVQDGLEPNRDLFAKVCRSKSLLDALEIYERWKGERT